MEDFSVAELVIPGTYIRVRAEALISAGGVSYGNIGIVGTAKNIVKKKVKGEDGQEKEVTVDLMAGDYKKTLIFSDFKSAQEKLGAYDAYNEGKGRRNLTRALELLFQNGAQTVYVRALDSDDKPNQAAFQAEFEELVKDDVNLLVAPELTTDEAKAVFGAVTENAENYGKDLIAVIGSDAGALKGDDPQKAPGILDQVPDNDRIIFTAPAIIAFDAAASAEVTLDGTYSAAAVAGLISALTPQSSPTNKVLPGVVKLATRFSYGELESLVKSRVLVLEQRQGVRVVRGITSESAAFKQVTTRRITDFAKAGIRMICNPFIGRLNNVRVRKAMQGAIDGFLTSMVDDEALVGYQLQVTATRQDEIEGRAVVNVVMQPTFSIDYIAVTIYLS